MADRHDIDALLVDAVYRDRDRDTDRDRDRGPERGPARDSRLDGADRARLDAYLASHPQERAALDAMKHTRARVQEARLGLPDAEPPAAISALLLQEAARRAPARRAAGGGGSGGVLAWLQGALRPMFAHPALASAAALVLVGGTAGALYLRTGSALYEPTASPAVEPAAVAPEVARAEPPPADSYGATFAATLDDPRSAEARGAAAGLPDVTATLTGDGDPAAIEALRRRAIRDSVAAPPATAQVPAKGRGALARSMDVTTTDPGLKTLDDEDDLSAVRKQKAAPRPAAKVVRQEAAAAGADRRPGAPEAAAASAAAAEVAAAPPPAASPAPPPPAASPAPATARYDATREEERASWARGQHQRAIAAVKRNDCNEAAALAAEIAVRAAEYYTARVSDDRNLRACKPAIERARKRDAERRAKSRAPAANESSDADSVDGRR